MLRRLVDGELTISKVRLAVLVVLVFALGCLAGPQLHRNRLLDACLAEVHRQFKPGTTYVRGGQTYTYDAIDESIAASGCYAGAKGQSRPRRGG